MDNDEVQMTKSQDFAIDILPLLAIHSRGEASWTREKKHDWRYSFKFVRPDSEQRWRWLK